MSTEVAATRRKLKYLASIDDDVLGKDTDPQFEIQYVDIGNVDSSGNIREIATYRFEQSPSRARKRVRDGDVIISTVRTYLQAIAPIQNPPDNLIVSTGFAVVRPRQALDSQYCKYAVRESGFLTEVKKRSVGVHYPAISNTELAGIPVYSHSLQEQRIIAEYLDEQTGRIDRLSREHQSLLAILEEKRRALITSAVFRGLDPDVPLRDSGIPWIGHMPAHWKLERARWLCRERDERSVSGEEELLTVSHLTGVTPRSEKNVYMFEAETTEGYKVCHEDDLVVNTLWAWMGAMGVTSVDGIVSPAYHVYEIGYELDPSYVDLLVRLPTFAQEVTRHSKGVWSSRLRLYPEGLFNVTFPVPPIEEQQQIVSAVASHADALNQLMEAVHHAISLLSERRSSLISAAVTGQIEIEKVV